MDRTRMGGCVAALLMGACSGSGSDVGPRLDHVPDASHKVLVLDDARRAVAAASVAIEGRVAVTGRSGRGELFANPRGRQLVTVAADNATAAAGDRLQSLAFAAEIAGTDLPLAVFLPDTSASATLAVTTGVPLAAQNLDDSAQSGATLRLATNTVVTAAGATATLRLGALAREHLPGELPVPVAGARLWVRGVFVEPATATFSPPADLELADDLQVLAAGATVQTFRLDPVSGEWTPVTSAVPTDNGGRMRIAAAIAQGGLHAFAVDVGGVATVRGRLLDARQQAVFGALVRVDAARTISGGDGRFSVTVPGVRADGTARSAVGVDVRGGAFHLPVGATFTTPPLDSGVDVDLGDLLVDTLPAGNVRLQLVFEGRAVPFTRLAFGSAEGTVAGAVLTDGRGQATMEDVPAGFFGLLNGQPSDRFEVLIAEAVPFLPGGRRWQEMRLFLDDRNWLVGSRSTRAQVVDELGTGPVRDAVVVRGSIPGGGFSGLTRDAGVVFVGRAFDGRATATARTVNGGTTVVSAFTIDRPDGDHLELPVRRALRASGAFDRHGTLTGGLPGFVGGADRVLRASRPLEFDEWFDQVVLGVDATNVMPTRVDAAGAGTYRAGVALPVGNVVAVEGTTSAGVFTPTGVAAALELEVAEGTASALDLPLRRTFAAFTVPAGFADLDPALTVADFRCDLALRRPSGLVVDMLRGFGGGIAQNGLDAVLQLPALADEFAGGRWLAALSATSAGGAVRQQAVYEFEGAIAAVTPLLPVPTITAPTDGATVAADGFAVEFALPDGTLYATIELASAGAERLHWIVVVPPDRTRFEFVRLPTEAFSPLVAGRSYTLTLTAVRADTGLVLQQQQPYRELTTLWQTIGAGERGVRALSSRTIQLTLAP